MADPRPDLQADVKLVTLFSNLDFATTLESALVDVSDYAGRGTALLVVTEDTAQAATEKLDVTLHLVTSDSEAPTATNQIGAFTQIVGSSFTAAADMEITEQIAVPFHLAGTDDKKWLQAKATETNTYEGEISLVVALGGSYTLPVN